MPKILGPNAVTNPQVMQYLFMHPDGIVRRCSIYTGLLSLGHGAGQDTTPLDIEFPLIGNFAQIANPPGTKGILPLSHPIVEEFRAATVSCSLSTIVDHTDTYLASILSLRVELVQIGLDQPREQINAVVLFATIQVQNGELNGVGYQVNVLERLVENVSPEPPADVNSPSSDDQLDLDLQRPFHPRLLHRPPFNWNGQYTVFHTAVGDTVVIPGSAGIQGTPQQFS